MEGPFLYIFTGMEAQGMINNACVLKLALEETKSYIQLDALIPVFMWWEKQQYIGSVDVCKSFQQGSQSSCGSGKCE